MWSCREAETLLRDRGEEERGADGDRRHHAERGQSPSHREPESSAAREPLPHLEL